MTYEDGYSDCYGVSYHHEEGEGGGASAGGGGGGTGLDILKQVFLDPAVHGAENLLFDPSCAGLFGRTDADGRTPVSEILETAYDNNQIRFIDFGADIPVGVGAQTTGTGSTGIIYIADNRYFVTGILANGVPVNQATTPNFVGLSLQEVNELIIIHELLHLTGVVGDDNAGQQITLGNGDIVTGSAGVSNAVRENCRHH
jgi:hypothetical protein